MFKVSSPFYTVTSAQAEPVFVTEATCFSAPPETEEQKAARIAAHIAKKKRIEELLDELYSLGWEPPEPWNDNL